MYDAQRKGMVRLVVMMAVATGACSVDESESTPVDATIASGACTPNQSIGCVSTNGCQGYQLCNDRGDAYGVCVCSASSGTTGGSNGNPSVIGSGGAVNGVGGSGAVSSSGGTTLGGNTSNQILGGGSSLSQGGANTTTTLPAGGSGNTTGSCTPQATLGSWSPPAYVPARSKQAVCTDTEIRSYLDTCLQGASCPAFESGGGSEACGQCLEPSPVSDSAWGPLLEAAPAPFYRWDTNPAGCVELQGYPECAAKLQAVVRCAEYACTSATCGPLSSGYDQCTMTARNSVCKPYFDASVCIPNQTVQQACYGGSDFNAAVLTVGRAFCGVTGTAP